MQKTSNSYINKNYLKKQLILIVVAVAYILSLVFTLGRYVLKKVNTYVSATKEFYFYSDKLKEEETEYPISWSGTEECIIPINLYTKINSLKKATHDIKYKVEYELLSSNAVCTLSKESGIVTTETNNDTFTVSILPNSLIGENDKITVKVNVTTVDDFEKTLTEKFIIRVNDESASYKIDDEENRPYFDLIISNMQKENITITFDPNEILIDTTSNIFKTLNSYGLLTGTNYINKISFTVNTMSGVNIRFYKKDKTKDYTDNTSVINFSHEQI